MQHPTCQAEDYIQFLLSSPLKATCTEASVCSPQGVSHDAFTRLLARVSQDPESLWREAKGMVRLDRGCLVIDDSVEDKPYALNTALVHWQWSGKHHKSVPGVGLETLLWTDGKSIIPCDIRLYDAPNDGISKNEHFQNLLQTAKDRGFHPEYVLFDSWYGASLENLKFIARQDWLFLTRLKPNRQVNPTGQKGGNVAVEALENIPEFGQIVHLKGFGMVRLFRVVYQKEAQYWCTNDLNMSEIQRQILAEKAWNIEVYHRGLKNVCHIEHFQCQAEEKVRGHILLSIRAFLRFEYSRIQHFISWYENKLAFVREAVRDYLQDPTLLIPATA